MKRLTALLTAMMLVLSFGAALAEEAVSLMADPYVPQRVGNVSVNRGPERIEQTDGKGTEYDARYADGKLKELDVKVKKPKTGKELNVKYNGKGEILSARYFNGGMELTYDGKVWRDMLGNIGEGPSRALMRRYYNSYYPYGDWYRNNTMGLVGVSLRDQYPGLTDKWYNVIAVDLTQEGAWSYPMAVSNKYYMGRCIVTVRDGKVTVDYTIPNGRFFVKDQCMAWFTDVKDITPQFLNNPRSSFRYGQPVSVQDDLGGKDVALLFICNHIDYCVPLLKDAARPSRLLRGNIAVKTAVADYLALIDRMGGE